jgi:nucleotide-binding universal stress UspA family protein
MQNCILVNREGRTGDGGNNNKNSHLHATDLTKKSAFAFRYDINSAQKHDAKIHILHVLEKLSPSEEANIAVYVYSYLPHLKLEKIRKEKKDELIDQINKRLSEFAKQELKDDPETMKRVVSILVVDVDPADQILKKADELNCDVIIMGTHGKGLLTHTFLGSVSEKVLHRSRKPVFIIPIPKEDVDIPLIDI